MSNPNSDDGAGNAADEERTTTTTAAAGDTELHALAERLAELRAQGILGGGEGPRGSLWPVTDLPPGTLKRFLDRQYRDYREPNQE